MGPRPAGQIQALEFLMLLFIFHDCDADSPVVSER